VRAISPLTLDNNERDFTVLAQSIGPLMRDREREWVGRRMSQMMIERSPRDNGAISRLGYLCVMQRVGYYYHHYCPLTTTSMAPIERKKERTKNQKWNHFLFWGVFVLFRWYMRGATLAEFTLSSLSVGENNRKQPKIKIIFPSFVILSPPRNIGTWNITLRYDLEKKKQNKMSAVSYISIPHKFPMNTFMHAYTRSASRESWKNVQISHADLTDSEIRRKNLNGGSRTLEGKKKNI
jgi:hypothetical protein